MAERDGVLRLVAAFKLVKGAILVAVAAGALSLLDEGRADTVRRWAAELRPGNHFVDVALAKVTTLDKKKLEAIGAGGFLYAALFLLEGIGLWLRKHWAEWLTVIITGSFLPFEIYELTRRFSPLRLGTIVVNVVVVAYLVWHIRRRRR